MTRLLRNTAIFVLMVLACGRAGAFDFGNIDLNRLGGLLSKGQKAAAEVDEEGEIALGREVASRLLGAAPLVRDPRAQRYLNQVGVWVAQHTERPHLPWRFGIVDSDSVNAFAAPGGYVFVTRGLFMAMRDEAELAGVLAHEQVHVLRRHHLNAIKSNARAGMLGDLAAMLADSQGRDVGAWVDTGMDLYARGLDKEDEFEADLAGVVIAARSGYPAQGLRSVLLTLANMNPADSALSLMFKTHPLPGDRLQRLDDGLTGRTGGIQGGSRVANRLIRVQAGLSN